MKKSQEEEGSGSSSSSSAGVIGGLEPPPPDGLSPVIHASYIDPCVSKLDQPDEMVAYDQASAAFSVPSTTFETSQELQGLLVQFDPLTVLESSESTNKNTENAETDTNTKPDTNTDQTTTVQQSLIDFVQSRDEPAGSHVEANSEQHVSLQKQESAVSKQSSMSKDEKPTTDIKAEPISSSSSSTDVKEPKPESSDSNVRQKPESKSPGNETETETETETENKNEGQDKDTLIKLSPDNSKDHVSDDQQPSKSSQNNEPAPKLQRFPSKTSIDEIPKGDENTDRPFDFQRFLEQLRHKSADPIARYVKSFLNEFNKRPWTCEEQVKIINDFKIFITGKMELCPPFSTLSEHEMVNATEGMEKLIMNRLYAKTFSPEIPANTRSSGHEEDIIHDKIIEEKVRIWSWIEARHLDLPDRFLRNGESFIKLASDELSKINHYRAPRDKVICILNCCKVIFGLLRQTKSEESADGFLPILIYVVIKAQPKDPISNVNYIQRFRSPERLGGETGYYLSSLIGAISFIEQLDRSQLSVTDEEFETNMERTVKAISNPIEPNEEKLKSKLASRKLLQRDGQEPPSTPERQDSPTHGDQGQSATSSKQTSNLSDTDSTSKTQATTEAVVATGTSTGAGAVGAGLNPSQVLYNSAGIFAAPFKSLSKIFESDPADADERAKSPSNANNNGSSGGGSGSTNSNVLLPEELAARQVSAEEHEARRIQQKEFESVVETLKQMFPLLDKEIIEDVLREKEGRVGAAVDACLLLVDS